jgi:N-methylhydantoinase B
VLDPVTLEVVRNSLPAVANEMAYDLQRSSYNMMIYEVRDFSCAIVDARGRLLSQNVGGVSHFVSDLDVIVKDAVSRFGPNGFSPGDAFLMNHQRVCGQHLNNMVAYVPIFVAGELFAFSMVRAHWVDVGGMSTGFGAGAGNVADPWMEGLQFDHVKIIEAGEMDQKLMRFISDNVRYPEASLGDLRAQLAACRIGAQRIEELVNRYGLEQVNLAVERVFHDSEERCRRVIEKISDGEYEAQSFIDHDFLDRGEHVMIRARVTVSGSDMVIDLTGCSRQRRSAINSRTRAAAYIAYKGITTPLEPLNEGSFGALQVEIDEGNFMMATFPAPMASWSLALPTVVDTILAALAPAMPDHVPAAHYATLGAGMVFFGTDPRTKKRFVSQTIEGGGWGGRPRSEGESGCVSVCQGDVRNAPIENLELKYPVRVECRRLREDSGGAGRHRGGLGMVTEIRNLTDGTWSLSFPGREGNPPWGLWGGRAGLPGRYELRTVAGGPWEHFEDGRRFVPADAVARALTGGGGGWGDPFDRPAEAVAEDILEGLVTPEAAQTQYGVVVDRDTGKVDQVATASLRGHARTEAADDQ